MSSSPSVSGLEPTSPTVAGPLAPAPLARWVAQARVAGYFLAASGAVGMLASLKSSSLFSFALAAISTAGAVWLLWAIHLLGLSQEAVEVPTGRRQGLGGIGAGALMVQMVGRVCELAVSFGRAIGKVLACVIAGAGTGLVTMGVFALRQPDLWQYEAMQRAGPPLAPLLFGAGVGLLTTEFLLIVLFRRSWFRPAKAVVEASTVRPREGESSSSGGTSGGRHAG